LPLPPSLSLWPLLTSCLPRRCPQRLALPIAVTVAAPDPPGQASENQSRLLGRLTALGTSLKATQASLESRIDSRFEAITRLEAAVDAMGKSMEAVHEKLDKIGEAMGVSIEKAGDDDEDRKRIKERLKEALDVHKRQQGLDRVGYIEYLFGVCKADGRVGKFGSRFENAVVALLCSLSRHDEGALSRLSAIVLILTSTPRPQAHPSAVHLHARQVERIFVRSAICDYLVHGLYCCIFFSLLALPMLYTYPCLFIPNYCCLSLICPLLRHAAAHSIHFVFHSTLPSLLYIVCTGPAVHIVHGSVGVSP
jgi:hypothetical protein